MTTPSRRNVFTHLALVAQGALMLCIIVAARRLTRELTRTEQQREQLLTVCRMLSELPSQASLRRSHSRTIDVPNTLWFRIEAINKARQATASIKGVA